MVCVWGWGKQKLLIEEAQKNSTPIMVMERGYLGDRFRWTSIGFNGLNGRAVFPSAADDGQRFEKHFGRLIEPWKVSDPVRALLIGQVYTDAAVSHIDFKKWASSLDLEIFDRVIYRPHPQGQRDGWHPHGTFLSRYKDIRMDLANSDICITFNSNSGVDAVMFGVPTITFDEGSMAWDVSTHDLFCSPLYADRREWTRRLAWCQWTEGEISDGTFWEYVKEAYHDEVQGH